MKIRTKQNKIETGRSMMEMLGVLAIVGVLSVGALAGYSKAMSIYNANKAYNRLSQMIIDIKELYINQKNYDSIDLDLLISANVFTSKDLYDWGSIIRPKLAQGYVWNFNPSLSDGGYNFEYTLNGLGNPVSVDLCRKTMDFANDTKDVRYVLMACAVLGGTTRTCGRFDKDDGDFPISTATIMNLCSQYDSFRIIFWINS